MRNLNKIVTAITILLSFLSPLSGLAQSAEAEAWADKSLQAMSPDEKIGQLFMIALHIFRLLLINSKQERFCIKLQTCQLIYQS